jgi:hypothetical protein
MILPVIAAFCGNPPEGTTPGGWAVSFVKMITEINVNKNLRLISVY